MLPRQNRLVAEKDFERVYRLGKRAATNNLRLFFLPGAKHNQNISRFGFVVGRGQAVGVVERNRLKRRLRHRVQFLLPQLLPGYDVIIQPKREVLRLSSERLQTELETVFGKAGLFKKG